MGFPVSLSSQPPYDRRPDHGVEVEFLAEFPPEAAAERLAELEGSARRLPVVVYARHEDVTVRAEQNSFLRDLPDERLPVVSHAVPLVSLN
jgi:hypothetical protein